MNGWTYGVGSNTTPQAGLPGLIATAEDTNIVSAAVRVSEGTTPTTIKFGCGVYFMSNGTIIPTPAPAVKIDGIAMRQGIKAANYPIAAGSPQQRLVARYVEKEIVPVIRKGVVWVRVTNLPDENIIGARAFCSSSSNAQNGIFSAQWGSGGTPSSGTVFRSNSVEITHESEDGNPYYIAQLEINIPVA